MTEYHLLYSETSRNQIRTLHPDIKSIIRSSLDRLRKKPYSGKKLEKKLSGYRSLRTRKYRIIYKLIEVDRTIEIHYVGQRKDIYELFFEKVAR